MSEKLPVGTRIRFLRELSQGPTGETPPFLFAPKDGLGTVVEDKYGCWEGHMVKWDGWPKAGFGAQLGVDFEHIDGPVIVEDLHACMEAHNHKDVACAMVSCRDCKHSKSTADNGSDAHSEGATDGSL